MTDRPPRESLEEILTIDKRSKHGYGASLESFWGGTVKGDLIARALLVATDDTTDEPCGIQAAFTGPARPDVDTSLTRETLGEARRRVELRQEGEIVAEVTTRFGPTGDGLSYQGALPEAGLPAPEDLPSEREQGEAEGWAQYAVGPIESRRITIPEPVKDNEPAVWLGWLRPRTALADEPRLHAAALAFLGEYRSHWAVERRLGTQFPQMEITLLDHSLWIHRLERWDDFWLVRTLTDVGVGGRCFSRREIFTRGGTLVASAAWEAIARPR